MVRRREGVDQGALQSGGVGRRHDNRHTLVTELTKSGAGDEGDHEHCRARLVRTCGSGAPTCGWKRSGSPATNSSIRGAKPSQNNLTVTCGRYHATVCVIGRWHGNPKQRPDQPRSHRRSDILYHRQRLPPSAPQSSRCLTECACRRRPCCGSKRQSRTVEQQASAKWSMHQVGSADGETPPR